MSTLPLPIADFWIGPVRVVVRYGCVRRDQYELLTESAFPPSLKERLAELGTVRGTEKLYTVDVAGTHQLTVAPERGRMVIMPRLSTQRAGQRQRVQEVAELLGKLMEEEKR